MLHTPSMIGRRRTGFGGLRGTRAGRMGARRSPSNSPMPHCPPRPLTFATGGTEYGGQILLASDSQGLEANRRRRGLSMPAAHSWIDCHFRRHTNLFGVGRHTGADTRLQMLVNARRAGVVGSMGFRDSGRAFEKDYCSSNPPKHTHLDGPPRAQIQRSAPGVGNIPRTAGRHPSFGSCRSSKNSPGTEPGQRQRQSTKLKPAVLPSPWLVLEELPQRTSVGACARLPAWCGTRHS